MKVPRSVRHAYEQRAPNLAILKKYTDEKLRPVAEAREGLYLSRIKNVKSVEQALETGRWPAFNEVPDLFAATIVVGRKSELIDLESELNEMLSVVQRRPPAGGTLAAPEYFAFDDIRLIVQHKKPVGVQWDERVSSKFELQIKTFLQHAWSRATHEPVYKGEIMSWTRSRIAAQARACLEQTELAVEAVSELALKFGDPEYAKYSELKRIADVLFRTWTEDRLPPNRKRFVECVGEFLSRLNLSVDDLGEIVEAPENVDVMRSLNVSPFQAIIAGSFRRRPDAFRRLRGKRYYLVVTQELLDLEPKLKEIQIVNNVEIP
jgi:hypothetical protein